MRKPRNIGAAIRRANYRRRITERRFVYGAGISFWCLRFHIVTPATVPALRDAFHDTDAA